MKKLVAAIMLVLVVFMVGCSAFAEGNYPEVESMISEEENIWFSMVLTFTGDPEFEEAPDPHKTYTMVVYIMKDNTNCGKPGYLGLYCEGKLIDSFSGYLIPEVTKETAADTANAMLKSAEHDLPTVYLSEITYYGD